MKNNTLSNFDINNILKHLGVEIIGIYAKDRLPAELKKGFYIINLNNHNEEGSHWTAFYYNSPNYSIYFDAFGFPAPTIIENRIKPYIFNDRDIQAFNSTACGYFCIAFIYYLYFNHDKYGSFETFVDLFSDTLNKNDEILQYMLNMKIT